MDTSHFQKLYSDLEISVADWKRQVSRCQQIHGCVFLEGTFLGICRVVVRVDFQGSKGATQIDGSCLGSALHVAWVL